MAQSGFRSPFGENANPFGVSEDTKRPEPDVTFQTADDEEDDIMTSPKGPSTMRSNNLGFRGPFGGDASSEQPASFMQALQPNPDNYPAQYNFARRTSVSAESLQPAAEVYDNWQPPSHPKTPDQMERLKHAIEGNFLFSHLEDEQSAQILGALVEKPIPAKDIKVVTQGDAGDFFYVVEKGSFDVFVNPAGSLQSGPDGLGNKVGSIGAGGSFGELALMYNAPRAATVMSTEPHCTLWALDRVTFRRILMESTFARRRMYESFLEEVPLLQTLTPYERSKIADALETQKFVAGTNIIQEGDPGHAFYLLESGEAHAMVGDRKEPTRIYKKGDFFGELALLNDAPRAATVLADSDVKVATLGKSAFQRLLGPVEGILRRTRYDGAKPSLEDLRALREAGE